MYLQARAEELHTRIVDLMGEILTLACSQEESIIPKVQILLLTQLDALLKQARESRVFPQVVPIPESGGKYDGIFGLAQRVRNKEERVTLYHAVQDLFTEVGILEAIRLS